MGLGDKGSKPPTDAGESAFPPYTDIRDTDQANTESILTGPDPPVNVKDSDEPGSSNYGGPFRGVPTEESGALSVDAVSDNRAPTTTLIDLRSKLAECLQVARSVRDTSDELILLVEGGIETGPGEYIDLLCDVLEHLGTKLHEFEPYTLLEQLRRCHVELADFDSKLAVLIRSERPKSALLKEEISHLRTAISKHVSHFRVLLHGSTEHKPWHLSANVDDAHFEIASHVEPGGEDIVEDTSNPSTEAGADSENVGPEPINIDTDVRHPTAYQRKFADECCWKNTPFNICIYGPLSSDRGFGRYYWVRAIFCRGPTSYISRGSPAWPLAAMATASGRKILTAPDSKTLFWFVPGTTLQQTGFVPVSAGFTKADVALSETHAPLGMDSVCSTLEVGYDPTAVSEETLSILFSTTPGYQRHHFDTNLRAPVCFVEFEDDTFASRARYGPYNHPLHPGIKAVGFSTYPLGVKLGEGSDPATITYGTKATINGSLDILSLRSKLFDSTNRPWPDFSLKRLGRVLVHVAEAEFASKWRYPAMYCSVSLGGQEGHSRVAVRDPPEGRKVVW